MPEAGNSEIEHRIARLLWHLCVGDYAIFGSAFLLEGEYSHTSVAEGEPSARDQAASGPTDIAELAQRIFDTLEDRNVQNMRVVLLGYDTQEENYCLNYEVVLTGTWSLAGLAVCIRLYGSVWVDSQGGISLMQATQATKFV